MRSSTKIFVNINNMHVRLDRNEPGYYLGVLHVLTGPHHESLTFFHVEAIELNEGEAINPLYQNRIDRWVETNEGLDFQRVVIGRREYFLNIEVYAR